MNPTAIVFAFNDAIATGEVAELAPFLTKDHRFVDSAGHEIIGRAAVVTAWESFFKMFPGYRNSFAEARVAGDRVSLRGRSHCTDARLDGPALWRATLRGVQLAAWEVFDDSPEARARLGFGSG